MSESLPFRLRHMFACACKEPAEAADRIERLEAALTHIYAWYPVSVSDPAQTIKDIREFARKALEGKDE